MEQFLLVGTFGAVGAALAAGTGAALLRYHRTGDFPGAEDGSLPRARLVALWLRVIVGAAIATYAVVDLRDAGLL